MDDMKRDNTLYLVIPCFNEHEVLPETEKRLTAKLKDMIRNGLISEQSRIVFVDDGSKDDTWELIEKMHSTNPFVFGIKSSRNRGHQFTLLEGIETVKDRCGAVITMDADLQDDIEVLDQFMQKYLDGCDIVYGVRNSRATDSWFKRTTAQSFYRLISMMHAEIVYNHADYRLMSRRAMDALSCFEERNVFLRGIVPLIGYQTGTVEYERHERFAGTSKYPLGKMLSFAWDGITSLTIWPIRLISAIGLSIFLICIGLIIYMISGKMLGRTVEGWVGIMVSIWGIGGLILLSIGVIGEYIGKTYLEVKRRPRYIVEKVLFEESREEDRKDD